MKTGMSWNQFMDVATKAETLKHDYEVRTGQIHAVYGDLNGQGDKTVGLHLENTNTNYRLGPVAHEQLATLTQIPRAYYDRMLKTHPSELANLIEMHMHQDEGIPPERFVRTIGHKVRALLSTRYGVLDHIDVAKMLDMHLHDTDAKLQSVLCTERRLTFQFLFPKMQFDIAPKVGDVVQAGIAITNSEVGLGMYRLEALLFRLACTNGMISPGRGEWKLERVHRGTPKLGELADFTDDRLKALPDEFGRRVRMAQRADGLWVPEEEIVKQVEKVRKDHALTLPETEKVLDHFYQEGRWTQWGLAQAVNFQAHEAENDRSVELERISGAMLDQYY